MYSVIFCVSEQLKFLITLCEIQTERRLKTAVWACDTQTTAPGWINQARITLVKFWWVTIIIKIKMIIVTYRSCTLGTCVRYYWCANEPCMCALDALITITSYFCLNTVQYIHIVLYSKCFIMDACVFWRSLLGSWCLCSYGHQTLQT